MTNLVKNGKFYLKQVDADLRDNAACENEGKLWSSFRSGSRESINIIFDRYVRLMYAYGRRMTNDEELIADCIQDIFFELWVKRESLAPSVGSIKHYLLSCVRRRIVRKLTAGRRIQMESFGDGRHEEMEEDAEYSLIRDQTALELNHQLKSSFQILSKAQQEAMHLRFYENMSYEDIAKVMGTNVKAVYNLIGRSIASLREFFKTHPIVTG